MNIDDDKRRNFYLEECIKSNWSVRQLERQINSFYYERLISTKEPYKEEVKNEINILEKKDKIENFVKDPYVLEFLDIKEKEDNPTIGIILCSDKKDTIVKYSVLNDNKNLFASKYQLYLPTEKELALEIEKQKAEFNDNN